VSSSWAIFSPRHLLAQAIVFFALVDEDRAVAIDLVAQALDLDVLVGDDVLLDPVEGDGLRPVLAEGVHLAGENAVLFGDALEFGLEGLVLVVEIVVGLLLVGEFDAVGFLDVDELLAVVLLDGDECDGDPDVEDGEDHSQD